MVTRLSSTDTMLFLADTAATTATVGSLLLVRRAPGVEFDSILALVESRLQLVPRFRQKVREVTFGLARPVWVDDTEFDITYHVRRSALPEPGRPEQLHELIGRLMSRSLDRGRPLWEMYVIEGLADGRTAVFTRAHEALVDGASALDLAAVITDDVPTPARMPEDLWHPVREPGGAELVFGAVTDAIARPWRLLDGARRLVPSPGDVVGALCRIPSAVDVATSSAPNTPLVGSDGAARRYTVARLSVADGAEVKEAFGCGTNDVLLATLAGALRRWLLSRAPTVPADASVRVLVPHSAFDADDDGSPVDAAQWTAGGLRGYLADLPVGEENPCVRLTQVALTTRRSGPRSRKRVSLRGAAWLPEIGPASFHAMSARAVATLSRRSFTVPVTVARGPSAPVYLAGGEVEAMFPVPVLALRRAVSVGITTYNGHHDFGVNADHHTMWDVAAMSGYLTDSFNELVEAARRE